MEHCIPAHAPSGAGWAGGGVFSKIHSSCCVYLLQEWKHINGMKALGIPMSKQYFEVTQISDALALSKNLQEREKGENTIVLPIYVQEPDS